MTRPSPFLAARRGRVGVVAHRGLSATEPENTMRAFRAAHAAGADLIECDVHLARDGVPVVIHDETLERTTGARGRVRDRTAAELRGLDAGAGERIPTLDELAAWAARAGATLSVELKQPAPYTGEPRYRDLARAAVAVLRTHGLRDRVLVHSFDHATLREVRDLDDRIPTGALQGGGVPLEPLRAADAVGASGLHVWWSSASAALAREAHAAGLHLHAWGMGETYDEAVIAALVRCGVDSLDADDPARLRRILDALGGPEGAQPGTTAG